MARCKLDFDHPRFKHDNDPALKVGFRKLADLVALDHRLSMWVNHPMPGFKAYQNRIWKWDMKPEGNHNAGRKGWRLYAYLFDPEAKEPITATAFLCYDKNDSPKNDHTSFLVKALKKFLSEADVLEVSEERFRRQRNDNGETISLCYRCCDIVATSLDLKVIDNAEGSHHCP